MNTIDVTNMDDRLLNELADALMIETRRRDLEPAWEAVRNLSDGEINDLHDVVDDEVELRARKVVAVRLAHELEQGEAREELGEADREKLFLLRVARLFKLAELNAPDPILNHAVDLVLKARPKE